MQHQYWVTRKSVLRKLGGKEDECIVSSDAELDAKLELFKSINDNCIQLQRVIDLYQERLCCLVQEENALGRYLKECGKNEKNASAGQIMAIAGKALAYTGHQRLTIRSPLVRLHHEAETFKCRAVSDTRVTVVEMEKARTEYRAALSWMKSVSAQLDPDTGHGLDQFRKSQRYVKTTKKKFDRLTLTCLQKVDLLAAARCNMFSHALVPYQTSLLQFATKASETLNHTTSMLEKIEPGDTDILTDLTAGSRDKDQSTFFKAEYTDDEKRDEGNKDKELPKLPAEDDAVSNLIGEDFSLTPAEPTNNTDTASASLLELSWMNNQELLLNDAFMPSKLLQEDNFEFPNLNLETPTSSTPSKEVKPGDKATSNGAQMSWLSLFAELDPLANPEQEQKIGSDWL